ncbi:MAG: hypothetical protein KDI29_07795, partial [Pseudomonadales bacterium]|nr:hypothetical protein [Pseudomonadales bacterium]
CAECYRERVVSGPEHLDAALIFATGFAPFRGGPIHYAQSLGLETVRQRLSELAAAHGPRFEPDAGWQEL